jgi:nicotinamidase-related amidase
MVIGGQCAHDRLARVFVVPDGGGEREDALQDADGHAARGAASVSFEVELALEEPGWELRLPVRAGPHEVVIRKTADDGFSGTPLAGLLAASGARSLAVCGVMSEMCVSATARTALTLGFRVVVARTFSGPEAMCAASRCQAGQPGN